MVKNQRRKWSIDHAGLHNRTAMSDSANIVFLSYASQDADAVARIRDALEAMGVQVWFDQEELKGGDAWDAAIRRRIKECSLFVPVISATTNARDEGYFRLEWKLAVDRSNLIAADKAFLLPVTLDGTTQSTARVPEQFLEIQWSSVSDMASLDAFAQRVKRLLDVPESAPEPARLPMESTNQSGTPRPGVRLDRVEKLPPPTRGLGFLVLGIFLSVLGGFAAFVAVSLTVPDLPYRILASEIGDARRVAASLLDSRAGDIQSARRLMSVDGRESIATLLTSAPSSANDWQLRRVLSREFNQIIKGDVRLDDGRETEAVGRAASNRKVLEAMFPEQLSVLLKPRHVVDSLFERAIEVVAIDSLRHGSGRDQFLFGLFILSLLFFVVWLPWAWVRQRPASIRFIFRDNLGVDELLAFLIIELGWRPPTRKGKALHFRPTLHTFLVWNVLRLTAWVDGTSVTVTGPEIFVRRLTETLVAHTQSSQ